MFRVIVKDEEIGKDYTQDFETDVEAIDYATDCNFWKFTFIAVQDESGHEILRFEN